MMRSLSSAVAGLRSHQTKMDVIGNNIANVNTYGYKASRTTFSDVFYQNLSSASHAGTATGGTNPTQIGYGSSVATIDILNTQSGAASTDRALDVYITGDGFLVTQDPAGNFLYTRLGNMGFDENGNLCDAGGNYIMGFPQNSDGSARISADGTASANELKNITVNKDLLDKLTGISISQDGSIIGILPGNAKVTLSGALPDWVVADSATISPGSNLQGSVKMNLGGYFDAAAASAAFANFDVTDVLFGDASIDAGSLSWEIRGGVLTMKGTRTENGVTTPVTLSGTLKNGKVVLYDDDNKSVLTLLTNATTLGADDGDLSTGTPITADLKYQLTTTDKGGNTRTTGPKSLPAAPAADGTYTLELEGGFAMKIKGTGLSYFAGEVAKIGAENGEAINIGCIVLAKFRNAAGLQQAGSSKYMESSNSGEATFVRPGLEGTGSLMAGSLEMSNVDISKEFTDMITTQRGFQANSRIVTVSDEMLQELVNLKR